MNGKAAKRIRLAAERQNYHGECAGETLRVTYRRLKSEYLASPYHARKCYGWPHHSHKVRIGMARVRAAEESLFLMRKERAATMAYFEPTPAQNDAAEKFFVQVHSEIDSVIERTTKNIADVCGLDPEVLKGAVDAPGRVKASDYVIVQVESSEPIKYVTGFAKLI